MSTKKPRFMIFITEKEIRIRLRRRIKIIRETTNFKKIIDHNRRLDNEKILDSLATMFYSKCWKKTLI
jgi:hypothetical protein